jgi:transposase
VAVANTRIRRALGCPPAERIAADRAAMLALPPVAPVTGWRSFTRLARDHYIRLDSNDYSVHPAVIGRRIEVTAGLDRVKVACEGRVVADHERIWAWHQTLSDPEHVEAARLLRRERMTVVRAPAEAEVQIRALSDYDAALGLDSAGGTAAS